MSEDSVPNSNEQKKREAGPAASFLWHALAELRIVGDSITLEDLEYFAEDLQKRLGLIIGSEEVIKEAFYTDSQFAVIENNYYNDYMRDLKGKITRSLQVQPDLDDEVPF